MVLGIDSCIANAAARKPNGSAPRLAIEPFSTDRGPTNRMPPSSQFGFRDAAGMNTRFYSRRLTLGNRDQRNGVSKAHLLLFQRSASSWNAAGTGCWRSRRSGKEVAALFP